MFISPYNSWEDKLYMRNPSSFPTTHSPKTAWGLPKGLGGRLALYFGKFFFFCLRCAIAKKTKFSVKTVPPTMRG